MLESNRTVKLVRMNVEKEERSEMTIVPDGDGDRVFCILKLAIARVTSLHTYSYGNILRPSALFPTPNKTPSGFYTPDQDRP